MNVVADEGVDQAIVSTLREAGHSVLSVAESMPGAADSEVLAKAQSAGTILLTTDKDFGELVFRQKLAAAGILLIRLEGLSEAAKAEAVGLAFRSHSALMSESFSVLSPGLLRIRARLDHG